MWGGRKGSACQAVYPCASRPPFQLLLLQAAAVSALSAKVDARDGAAAAAEAASHAAPRQLPYSEFTLADFGDSLLPLLPLVRQAASKGGCMRTARGRRGGSTLVSRVRL